ncbi:CcmD family protein [Bacillus sp. B15-48]|nr:CcmD family protein [Bacillus sp. B15-48]MBM4762625.1 CcmD family protein [Bacillus sp. B15-48]
MTYLLMAYSVTWALIAIYMVVLGGKQKKLEQEIRQLEEWKAEL